MSEINRLCKLLDDLFLAIRDEVIVAFWNQDRSDSEKMASARKTTKHFDQVSEFMKRAGQKVRTKLSLDPKKSPTFDERQRAANLILEEAEELLGGLGFALTSEIHESSAGVDIAEAIDGVFDLQVVTTCVLAMFGVPDVALRNLIDENNLAKFGPGHSIRDDGKLVKPADHSPVDIIAELEKMGAIEQ